MNSKTNVHGYAIPSAAEIIHDEAAKVVLRLALCDTFACIGVSRQESDGLVDVVFTELERTADFRLAEPELRKVCGRYFTQTVLRDSLDARARLVANQIREHMRGERWIDIGCGDGMVPLFVGLEGKQMLLADIINYVDRRAAHLPFVNLSQFELRGLARLFDTALLLTVLHHATNPGTIVQAIADLRIPRVVVIESVVETPPATTVLASKLAELDFRVRFAFAAFADWFYNRVLHDDVSVPFNFGRVADWGLLFQQNGYALSVSINLGVDQRLVPEVHQLLVYDLASAKV